MNEPGRAVPESASAPPTVSPASTSVVPVFRRRAQPQYALPLARGGRVELPGSRAIGIERIHMEEDAGKLLHDGFAWTREKSGVDFNRAGVPLIEIVTRPDLRGPEEAHAYLTALRALLVHAGVSDCDMEKGSLRCDANVSLRPRGERALGTRAEVKNLNSFRNVARALEHEILRQAELLDSGRPVAQETRLFDADRGETAAMRGKEEAHDYRYFPEPDLPPLLVSEAWVAEVRESLPELPAARRQRLVRELGLPEYDADVLTQEPEVADYFEAAARVCGDAKAASNWVMTDVLRKRKDDARPLVAGPVPPQRLGELIRLVAQGTINGNTAKQVFETMWASGEPAPAIVEREGLAQVSDAGALGAVIAEVIAASPQQVASYRAGKQSTLGWLVGQVMRKSGGKANPALVNRLLKERLDKA